MSEGTRRDPTYLYYKEIYEQNKRMEEKLDELIRVMSRIVDIIQDTVPERKLVYGIKGLADLLCCSESTANRIKASHVLDPAISQVNRTIVIDAEKALELLSTSKSKWTHLGKTRLKSSKK
jgi:hypothetical protein